MYQIYNKKLKYGESNPRLGLLHSSTVGIYIQITISFALRSEMVGKTIWISKFRTVLSENIKRPLLILKTNVNVKNFISV